jgi:hypothetical protein
VCCLSLENLSKDFTSLHLEHCFVSNTVIIR